jgi:hypothetical protein
MAPGQVRGGSRVHLLIARRRRHPTRPLRHRRGYPAARHHGLPIRPPTFREVPRLRDEQDGCASPPAQIRQVRAGASLRGVNRRFLAYAFSSRSPHPRRLAVPTHHGFVGAACHPSRHLPRPAAPSFTAPLRRDGGEGLSPPIDQQAPHGAPAERRNRSEPVRHPSWATMEPSNQVVPCSWQATARASGDRVGSALVRAEEFFCAMT